VIGKGGVNMKNLRLLILGGLLTGSLVTTGTSAMADPPGLHKGWEKHPGLHKGWEKKHHGWVKGDDDDDRYENHYRQDPYYGRSYQYSHPYCRHDVHNGVSDVRSARQDLADNRQQLKSKVQQLKTDKAELRKDMRNRASRTEIAQDRAAIRQDKQNIADSKKEVRQSKKDLKLSR
jgi:hypothetical protein